MQTRICSQCMVRTSRRGSVLIIVLGTLALLAVLAVIYVSVGNSDRRTSQAVVVRDRFDQVPDQIADYLAQVIADDVLSVYPQPGGMLRRDPETEHIEVKHIAEVLDSGVE